jgi:putative transposase
MEEVWWMNQLPVPRIKTPTFVDLNRELNVLKKSRFRWMYESSKCAPQGALHDLDRAFKNFFEGRARYPRFKSRHCGIGSFRLTGSIRVELSHLALPRLGRIRLKERGYLPMQSHILSVTVSEKSGRWYASLAVEENLPATALLKSEAVGVDLGVDTLATVSDGATFENPHALGHRERKLRHLHKDVSKKEKGSRNREKARERLSRCYAKVANARKDALNMATTLLASTKQVIVVESLRPRNLLRDHHLARSLSDASFGEFMRQLEYKCKWYGSTLVKADPFYPSTKRCSRCGNVKKIISLKVRIYTCDICGLVIDRDLNAARNLASAAASSAEAENACGDCVRPVEPSGDEAGCGLRSRNQAISARTDV